MCALLFSCCISTLGAHYRKTQRVYDDDRVVLLLEGVVDLLVVFFPVVFETVFLGLTVLASFLAPADADLFAEVDRLVVVAFLPVADVFFVEVFVSLEVDPAFLVEEADRDLVVLLLAGDFEAVFLLLTLVALLLRRSVAFTSVAWDSSPTAGVISTDCFLPLEDLNRQSWIRT